LLKNPYPSIQQEQTQASPSSISELAYQQQNQQPIPIQSIQQPQLVTFMQPVTPMYVMTPTFYSPTPLQPVASMTISPFGNMHMSAGSPNHFNRKF